MLSSDTVWMQLEVSLAVRVQFTSTISSPGGVLVVMCSDVEEMVPTDRVQFTSTISLPGEG